MPSTRPKMSEIAASTILPRFAGSVIAVISVKISVTAVSMSIGAFSPRKLTNFVTSSTAALTKFVMFSAVKSESHNVVISASAPSSMAPLFSTKNPTSWLIMSVAADMSIGAFSMRLDPSISRIDVTVSISIGRLSLTT